MTSPPLIVIRPKSIATVVVRLSSTPTIMSMLVPGRLSSSSVRRGFISVSAPTRVVLPTPNPPAIRILMATGAGLWWRPAGRVASKSSEAIGYLSEKPDMGEPLRAWQVNSDESPVAKVPEQDADHAEGQVKGGGEVGQGHG